MIMRIWRGWTTPADADSYEAIVSNEVLPAIAAREMPGYSGSNLLRRDLDEEVDFATIMLFESMQAVRDFAGANHETAYVPPRARAVLARFDGMSAHYTVLLAPKQTASPR